jgi:hypothetical protein
VIALGKFDWQFDAEFIREFVAIRVLPRIHEFNTYDNFLHLKEIVAVGLHKSILREV